MNRMPFLLGQSRVLCHIYELFVIVRHEMETVIRLLEGRPKNRSLTQVRGTDALSYLQFTLSVPPMRFERKGARGSRLPYFANQV